MKMRNVSCFVMLFCMIVFGSLTVKAQDLTITANGVRFVMKKVTGGTFQMGSNSEDAYDDEKPIHKVTVSSYYISETEVTQALWVAVMGGETDQSRVWIPQYGLGKDYPAYGVSWNDCQQFIRKLNNITGKNFRLPTEAEWEYAARGGNKSKGLQFAGSSNINQVAWYYQNGGNKNHPVKTKQANELGIYDMSGNVCEWCEDVYSDYQKNAQTNPQGPSSGIFRVHRGGSWNGDMGDCRVSTRNYTSFKAAADDLGFRLVLVL